jgi:membrane protein YdbS with pleckstrin-like domain
MYCSRCGNLLPEKSLFCNRCGFKVRSTPQRLRYRSLPPPPGRRKRRRYEDEEEDYYDYEPEEDFIESEDEDFDPDYPDDEFDEEEEEDDEAANEEEEVVFSINPAFHPVITAYLFSTAISIIILVFVSYMRGPFWVILTGWFVSFVPSIISHIRHIHTVFTLTTIKVEISQGLFSKTTRNIPLRHIQDVFVSETFRERLLGIGDIIIDTAADSNLTMNDVSDPRKYADQILAQLPRWD